MPLKKFRLNCFEIFKIFPIVCFNDCEKDSSNFCWSYLKCQEQFFSGTPLNVCFRSKHVELSFKTRTKRLLVIGYRTSYLKLVIAIVEMFTVPLVQVFGALKFYFKYSVSKTTGPRIRFHIYFGEIEQVCLQELHLPVLI